MQRLRIVVVFVLFGFLLFTQSFPGAYADTDFTPKKREQQDFKQALEYQMRANEGVPNTEISSTYRQASAQLLPEDADDDGMPDEWELAKGLDPNDPDDAWLDPDADEVINLFEYQLDSDFDDPASPPIATVAPSGADYTDVATAIDTVAPGTVIRVAGGTYLVNYVSFSSKVVEIQGGWSADFTQRDLELYPTTFDGGMIEEALYFVVDSDKPAIVLDGIHFINGNGFFGAVHMTARGTAFLRSSVVNCSITNSSNSVQFGGVLEFHSRDTSAADLTLANTLIADNDSSGIYSQNTVDAVAHWRIINSTLTQNRNAEDGDNGYGIEAITTDNGKLTAQIYNSIVWGNEKEALNIWNNITFDVHHSDFGDVSATFDAVYNIGEGNINADPLFVDLAAGEFQVAADSPVIDSGTFLGAPDSDIKGNPRPSGIEYDMGAYEYEQEVELFTDAESNTAKP